MEERYTDPNTGGQKGQKDARFGGADPLFLMELAKVYGMGEEKYARYNYLKGYPWSLSVDALFRHLFAFLAGEDRDPESGLLHTAHVAWHAGTLTSFQLRGVGTDNRAPAPDGQLGVPCVHGVDLARDCGECASDFEAEKKQASLERSIAQVAAQTKCQHGVTYYEHCEGCLSLAKQYSGYGS